MQSLNAIISDCRVISLPEAKHRRAHIEAVLSKHEIAFSFSNGFGGKSHAMGCTEAHLATLSTLRKLPALVLEDDVAPLSDELMLPKIPDDADIIYLGVSPFGCFPWQRHYIRQFGHRAIYNLTLSSIQNIDWLRLHSMAGAIAVLYVSSRGVEVWRKAMLTSLRRRRPFDVFTAYAMSTLM